LKIEYIENSRNIARKTKIGSLHQKENHVKFTTKEVIRLDRRDRILIAMRLYETYIFVL